MKHSHTLLAALLLVASACKTADPDRSLSRGNLEENVRIHEVPVRGSIATVKLVGMEHVGEVLAVDEESIWMRVENEELRVPRARVQSVELELYPSKASNNGLWTGVGTASTLTHGFGLLISAPLWLLIGIPATVSASMENTVVLTPGQLDLLRHYARFPQGRPAARPEFPEPALTPAEPLTAPPAEEGSPAGSHSSKTM